MGEIRLSFLFSLHVSTLCLFSVSFQSLNTLICYFFLGILYRIEFHSGLGNLDWTSCHSSLFLGFGIMRASERVTCGLRLRLRLIPFCAVFFFLFFCFPA